MEATQWNENKYNVATDHQTKQNKTKQNTIPKMRACVYGLYTLVNKSSSLHMYVYQSIGLVISIYLSVCLERERCSFGAR